MKKIIITTFVLLGVMSVQAQKNSILLGTDFGYERANGFGDTKTNKFSFSPVIAYEVAENWFIGAKTSLSYSEKIDITSSTAPTRDKVKDYATRIGGFVRYYQPLRANTFGVYADLGAGYQQHRSDKITKDLTTGVNTSIDAYRFREYGYYINFTPALFINFKNDFGLNISFGGAEWSDTKKNEARDYDNYSKSKSFDFHFGKSLSVGVTKKFTF